MAEFSEMEEVDGVRMVWNVWPSSRLEAAKCVVPFGVFYSPAKQTRGLQVVEYDPLTCKSCGGVLSPYAAVDFAAKLWSCPFCLTRNQFPPHYAGISEQVLPAELFPTCTTIEYAPPSLPRATAPTTIFLLDTAVAEDELAAARAALQQVTELLPETHRVGLVTFGTHVQVHELGAPEIPRVHVFRGSKDHPKDKVAEQLGLAGGAAAAAAAAAAQAAQAAQAAGQPAPPAPEDPSLRFLPRAGDAEFAIQAALEDLARDPFPAPPDARGARCTGAALAVAAGLAAAALPPSAGAARLVLLSAGPATVGPGKVVDPPLAEPIRSHKDLAKDAAPHFRKAKKHYDALAKQLSDAGHALDVFACSLDQIGIAEMKAAIESTGGLAVITDSFANPVFKDSFRKAFLPPGADEAEAADAAADAASGEGGARGPPPAVSRRLSLHSNARIEVKASRDIKICGALGPCVASGPGDGIGLGAGVSSSSRGSSRDPLASDVQVGQGGCSAWRLATLSQGTTLAVVFDICGAGQAAEAAAGSQLFLQFITRYLHEDGRARVRVTTLSRRWSGLAGRDELLAGFDQEAAAVLAARLASDKMEAEEDFDATRWLDRSLIRLCARFGDYRRDEPDSFTLRPEMAYYPQLLFNLRRSQFCQVFGSSPDETAHARLMLDRETVPEAAAMIQPLLYSFAMGAAPEPVLLDVSSILPDRVLLLDAYFYVVVFHGATVAAWRKAGYQNSPEHAAFKALLEAPRREADAIVARRFPTPRLTICDQNGSQARFLLARLNPSATYATQGQPGGTIAASEVILTDDVSLQVFTEHLKKLAVAS